jgi:hypothetical protein
MAPLSNSASILSSRLSNLNNTVVGFAASPDPHTSLQDVAIAIEIIVPVIALVVCFLRCYIRVSTKNLGWDDYWIFFAMLLNIGQAVDSVICMREALGLGQGLIQTADIFQSSRRHTSASTTSTSRPTTRTTPSSSTI